MSIFVNGKRCDFWWIRRLFEGEWWNIKAFYIVMWENKHIDVCFKKNVAIIRVCEVWSYDILLYIHKFTSIFWYIIGVSYFYIFHYIFYPFVLLFKLIFTLFNIDWRHSVFKIYVGQYTYRLLGSINMMFSYSRCTLVLYIILAQDYLQIKQTAYLVY